MPRLLPFAFLVALTVACPAKAQDSEILHSELPLWGPGAANVWPQHFMDGNAFGCGHPIKLGRWQLKSEDSDGADWFQFRNYGFVHCWMNIDQGRGDGPADQSRPGLLILLGSAGPKELWALQLGARPGSDYLLLARASPPGVIDRFDLLQRRCPPGTQVGGPTLDILMTRYCKLSSRRQLLVLAKRMAKLPPLGTLTFEAEPEM